jgi:hypothetical protein
MKRGRYVPSNFSDHIVDGNFLNDSDLVGDNIPRNTAAIDYPILKPSR